MHFPETYLTNLTLKCYPEKRPHLTFNPKRASPNIPHESLPPKAISTNVTAQSLPQKAIPKNVLT